MKETIFGRMNDQWNEMEALAKNSTTKSTGGKSVSVNMRIHRAWFAIFVHIYSLLAYFMRDSYENQAKGSSVLNWFMRRNFGLIKMYFTKTEAAAKASVVARYLVSEGKLPPIKLVVKGEMLVSSMKVPEGFAITSASTVGEVSAALIKSNPAMKAGDQISVLHLIQEFEDGIPKMAVKLHEFDLKPTSTVKFHEVMPASMFMVTTDRHIGTNANGQEGGMAYVLSREGAGRKVLVSTQTVVLTPNNTTYEKYSSEEKRLQAEASYVADADPSFLRPGGEGKLVDEEDDQPVDPVDPVDPEEDPTA